MRRAIGTLWAALLLGLAGPGAAQEPGRMVVVDIDISAKPDQAEGRLLWLGLPREQTSGDWLGAGAQPLVLKVSEPMVVEDRWTVVLPVRVGLRYFAIIDTNGSGTADPGESVGGPVELDGTTRLTVAVDRRLGEQGGERRLRATEPISAHRGGPSSDGRTDAPEPHGEGQPTEVTVDLGPSLVFFAEGRFVVVGFSAGRGWHRGLLPDHPDFLWTSEHVPLTWPVTLEVPLPSGLDLVFGLDLDGDGDLGAGDLVARPEPAFAPEDTARFRLDRTLPRSPAPPPVLDVRRPR